jgi:iron complex outermembrane receptor protein
MYRHSLLDFRWGNVNGSPGQHLKFLINGGSDLSDSSKLYYNAAYVYKK